MENEEILQTKSKEMLPYIIITQSVCVILILLTVLTVKFFFKDNYSEVKTWYNHNICVDTDINQVISEGVTDEI